MKIIKYICLIFIAITMMTSVILGEENFKVRNLKGEINLDDSKLITIYWNNPDELNKYVSEGKVSDVYVLFDIKLDQGKFLSEDGKEMIKVPYDALSYTLNPFGKETEQNAENTNVYIKIYYRYMVEGKEYISKSYDKISLGYNSYIVGGKSWSKKELELASRMGIILDEMRQDMSKSVSRYEFVKMLMKLDGYLSVHRDVGTLKFPDSEDSDINNALNLGIIKGADGGNFMGSRNLSKEEMATIIYRYLLLVSKIDEKKPSNDDLKIDNLSAWASEAFTRLIDEKIIQGDENGSFSPKKTVSREEATVMIIRILQL